MDDVRPHLKIINSVPSDDFCNDFKIFFTTDKKVLEKIFTSLELKPNKEINEELNILSNTISIDFKRLKIILKVGNTIFLRLKKKDITLEDLKEDFQKLKFSSEDFENVKLFYNDFGEKYAIKRLKYNSIRFNLYSLSPKITKILYEINLRVVEEGEGENKKIIDKIPVANIELETRKESKGIRAVIGLDITKSSFNATAEDLEKIIDDLGKIKTKLKTLSK